MTSDAVYHLRQSGRYTLAQRLHDAQVASERNAKIALIETGRALGRGDRAGVLAGMALVIAHYSAAGEVALADHWRMRRAAL